MNTYLTAIDHKLREIGMPHAQRQAIISEQESLLQELNDVHADLAEELGTATEYAERVAEQVGEPSTLRRYLSKPLRVFSKQGRASLWNVDDPRILQPHLLGFGWSINWAAVATKLGIVRPDDIDGEVVSEIPARALQATAFLPAAVTVAHGVALARCWKQLPSEVHTKWKLNGEAVQKTAPKETLLLPLVVSTVGAGFSAASLLKADDREDTLRVASLGALASTIAPSQLIGVLTEENSKLNPALVHAGVALTSVVASAACLVFPLFAGLKATWQKAGAA
ncbi:hypothetical protein HMPREF3042_04510 [Corynebacterium sp. HMSC074C05]|uniref:DUF5808 domain-containing protein n=1 Tax=Corynebacterium sp. HMSC074C05 TaxID=1739534 RepID=UPI0008A83720|nr:hypothetical protein [Corynebacterium sp. HMSC074C05]OHR33635.1 hypothetical protein HMPREF3042_04510 [Corynebacterium sp. HMSC074C05]